MKQMKFAQRIWGKLALVCLFVIWGSGFTAGLTAATCREAGIAPDKRVRYCTVSLVAGIWADVIPRERARRSVIRLERGIALAQLGRLEEARAEMAAATEVMVRRGSEDIRDRHLKRIAANQGEPVEALWHEVMDDLIAQRY